MSIAPVRSAISVVSKNDEAASSREESYFGSKLIQALAEYSGRFRSEFILKENDQSESNTK